MSESTVLTLDIGGSSDEAVAAVNATADALANLQSASQGAAGAATSAGAAVSGAGEQASGAGAAAESAGGSVKGLSEGLGSLVGTALGADASMAPLAESFRATQEGSASFSDGLAGMIPVAGMAIGVIGALGAAGGEWANETMRMQAIMGTSQDVTETWMHAIDIAGGSTGQLSTGIRFLGASLDGLGGAKKNADDFDALGVSLRNADGSAKSAGQVFTEVIPALAGMTDAAARDRAGQDLLGRGYVQLKPLIDNYAEAMGGAEDITKKHTDSMGNATQKAIEYNKAIENLKAEVADLGSAALPALVLGLTMVDDVLGQFGEHMSTAHSAVTGFGQIAGAAVGSFLGPWGMVAGFVAGGAAADVFGKMLDGSGKSAKDAAGEVGNLSGEQLVSTAASEQQTAALGHFTDATGATVQPMTVLNSLLAQQIANADRDKQTLDPLGAQMYEMAHAADAAATAQVELNQAMDAASSSAAYSGGTPSGVPGRAAGGPVSAGSLYRINEVGMEYFRPSVSGEVIPIGGGGGGGGGSSSGGGGNSLVIQININGPHYGIDDLFGQIDEHLREVLRDSTALRGYV